MTNQEIVLVNKLRDEGYGYKKIATETGLSLNTIKSFLKRNDETNQIKKIGFCENCHKEMKQLDGKKIKRFCSDACRMAWWKKHPEAVNRKANYVFTCPTCKKKFISYGNKTRKYCSRECYIFDRYGGVR